MIESIHQYQNCKICTQVLSTAKPGLIASKTHAVKGATERSIIIKKVSIIILEANYHGRHHTDCTEIIRHSSQYYDFPLKY